jgi:hypothetical protein
MFSFKFSSNSADVNRKMANMVQRQIPFATAKSLTLTAKTLVEQNKRDMVSIFDNPVAWTRNAFFFIPAKKNNPRTIIKRKDMASGSNVPPSKQNYLEDLEDGGGRKPKAFETALTSRARGASRFRYATPTRDTRTTAAGNIGRATINKILAQAATKGGKMFVPKSTHPLAQRGGDGVFERMAKGKVKKRLHLHNSIPSYRPQFNFYRRMNKYGRTAFQRIFKRELANAMRTARLR